MRLSDEEKNIWTDRMKYTKNASSARFCYLAIALDILYFINIYESDRSTWYYQLLIGVSIIYNLLFMLFTFLASEGVKNYKPNYSILLCVMGAIQLVRVFILPFQAMNAQIKVAQNMEAVMGLPQGIRAIVWLVLSAGCLFAAAAINIRKYRELKNHNPLFSAAPEKEVN